MNENKLTQQQIYDACFYHALGDDYNSNYQKPVVEYDKNWQYSDDENIVRAVEFGLKDGYDAMTELKAKSMTSSIKDEEITDATINSTIDKFDGISFINYRAEKLKEEEATLKQQEQKKFVLKVCFGMLLTTLGAGAIITALKNKNEKTEVVKQEETIDERNTDNLDSSLAKVDTDKEILEEEVQEGISYLVNTDKKNITVLKNKEVPAYKLVLDDKVEDSEEWEKLGTLNYDTANQILNTNVDTEPEYLYTWQREELDKDGNWIPTTDVFYNQLEPPTAPRERWVEVSKEQLPVRNTNFDNLEMFALTEGGNTDSYVLCSQFDIYSLGIDVPKIVIDDCGNLSDEIKKSIIVSENKIDENFESNNIYIYRDRFNNNEIVTFEYSTNDPDRYILLDKVSKDSNYSVWEEQKQPMEVDPTGLTSITGDWAKSGIYIVCEDDNHPHVKESNERFIVVLSNNDEYNVGYAITQNGSFKSLEEANEADWMFYDPNVDYSNEEGGMSHAK